MTSPSSIVVAGAGAIGRTVAYGLARAGHTVTVIDPDPAGGRASRIAAGMLAPAFESVFDEASHFALLRAALGLWRPLAREIGLPLACDGAMALGSRAEAETWAAALAALGADAELRDLGRGTWAAFCGEDCQLDAETALERLREAAERHGARHLTGRVRGFAGGRVEINGGATVAADALVIATGADQSLVALAPELARLTPIKGHILRAPGHFADLPAMRAPGVYLCRTPRGVILGATMELGRDDAEIDPSVVERLLAGGVRLSDGLDRLAWAAAAGVRAATPDGLPMAGAGATPGVILAVGARRNGWLLAPMIAEVVLGAVEGRPRGSVAERFDPRRF
ncbi:MAG TPA: FAD-dependent oxidoreductase [Caulobacteraceae bacterium]|nr:FAD-dependent oxidoreductase [Caulobacteraceae bacterium]